MTPPVVIAFVLNKSIVFLIYCKILISVSNSGAWSDFPEQSLTSSSFFVMFQFVVFPASSPTTLVFSEILHSSVVSGHHDGDRESNEVSKG